MPLLGFRVSVSALALLLLDDPAASACNKCFGWKYSAIAAPAGVVDLRPNWKERPEREPDRGAVGAAAGEDDTLEIAAGPEAMRELPG
jgi:hypothetical protein